MCFSCFFCMFVFCVCCCHGEIKFICINWLFYWLEVTLLFRVIVIDWLIVLLLCYVIICRVCQLHYVLYVGVSFMAPHINNLYFLTLCQKYGVYFVVRLLFWIKLLLSIGMLFIGVQHIWMVGLFIARWLWKHQLQFLTLHCTALKFCKKKCNWRVALSLYFDSIIVVALLSGGSGLVLINIVALLGYSCKHNYSTGISDCLLDG